MIELYKIPGFLGIVFLVLGIMLKRKKKRTPFFILGGLSLGVYSYFIGDMIFITLQVIYTAASVYEFFRIEPQRPWRGVRRQSQ